MAVMEPVAGTQLTLTLTDCVRQSVIAMFASMIGFEPEYIGEKQDNEKCDGFVGIIAFVGDMNWSLMLGLPRGTSTIMAEKFAGFEIDYETDDMGDVVGEMANIIAGDLVARLDTMGITVQLSTPSIARGKDLQILIPEGMPPVQLDFDSPEGKFWVKFSIAK